jgi:predicted Fe-Mo cluster-binding NifX family protein
VQGILFSVGKMSPPEKGTPRIVKKIQAMGAKTFILTSRGMEFFYPSVRELYRNGYNFSNKAVTFNKEYNKPGFFIPFNPKTVANELKLTKQNVTDFKLYKNPRPVLYNEGVFLTAGQHKGAMLKVWLKRTGFNPKAIIFVDDHEKHVKRVKAAFETSGLDVYSVHYTNLQDKVDQFKKSDKKTVINQWNKMKKAMDEGQGDKLDKIIHSTFL